MDYDRQLIGRQIKKARMAKRYTQDYVSARANIGEKFLSQIECGKAGLSVQTLLALCDILEVTPNYLLLAGPAEEGNRSNPHPGIEGTQPPSMKCGGTAENFHPELPDRPIAFLRHYRQAALRPIHLFQRNGSHMFSIFIKPKSKNCKKGLTNVTFCCIVVIAH